MAPARAALSFAVLFGAGIVLTNCIVLLPPIEHGEHCQFEGSTSCASCLRTSCQAPIDACCDDTSCHGHSNGDSAFLKGLDACGRGDATACASAMNGARGAKGDVASCVATSCKDECVGDATVSTPPPSWSCDAPRTQKTECATCIYESCEAQLTNCCGDTSCSSTSWGNFSQIMGACTGGDLPGCRYYMADPEYGGKGTSAGTLGAFEGCVVNECGESCFPAGVRMHNTCSLDNYGTSCSCSASATSSGVECSVEAIGGGTCVLGLTGCTCGTYACRNGTAYSDDCTCGFDVSGADTTCEAAEADHRCCLEVTNARTWCTCGESSCDANNELSIADCNGTTVLGRLKTLGRVVDVCSN